MYQKEYIRKDGTVFPVELRTFLLRNEAGEPTGMWAIVRDVTERKRADAALRVESAALNAAANAVVITDREGRIEWVNPAFETLTGLLGLGGPRQESPRPRQVGPARSGVLRGAVGGDPRRGVWRGEIDNRRKDGSL